MKKALLLILLVVLSCKNKPKQIALKGFIFGTTYNIQFFSESRNNYQKQIDSLFTIINNSLSTYQTDSDISKLNRNELSNVDDHFIKVFKASEKIYKETNGIFDPTIGNVVNAWNFGAETDKFLTDSTTIDSLMQFVGFNKVNLIGNEINKPTSTYLEFNAIAKGYGIDVIGDFLASKQIKNYLVEIGGDMVVAGINIEKEKPWRVGVQTPRFDGEESYEKIIELSNKGMATSGTYRKFKRDKNGNRYAHIINTKTGYPSKTNVLSVSVIAPNAILADGYATAFQAMGINTTKDFLKFHPELQVFFIYESNNAIKTLGLNNFPE